MLSHNISYLTAGSYVAAAQASIGAVVVWCGSPGGVGRRCSCFVAKRDTYAAGLKYSFDRLVPSKTAHTTVNKVGMLGSKRLFFDSIKDGRIFASHRKSPYSIHVFDCIRNGRQVP